MKKLLVIACLIMISTCVYCQTRYFCFEQMGRCAEIKKRLIYFDGAKHDLNGASNVQMSSVTHNAEVDNLQRAYRQNGCR